MEWNLMSGCVMMKTKKTVIEGEKTSEVEENGEFMQLRSRRLDKSAAALMVIKKRQNKGRGGRKRKAEAEVEKEEEKLEENDVEETNVKVDESVTKLDVVGPIDGASAKINYFDGVVENVGGAGYGGGATQNAGGGGDAATEIEDAGENFVPNDRAIRESTPENLIIIPNDIIATGSSTKAPGDDVAVARPRVSRRLQGGCKPSAKEMEDFFAAFERQQEKHFTEKYNFDFKNETPLPGRYEWVKVEP